NMTWGVNITETEEGYGLGHCDIYDLEALRFTGIWGLMDMNCSRTARDLYTRWTELRENVATEENICGILDERFNYLHSTGAYDRNYAKWPESLNDWDDGFIYEFVTKRLEYLDEFYLDYMEHPYTYY
ncbi:MAG: hypothetical protein HUJ98_06380, partial [Bacteroidaceae bacterium]|nr:hypothetical protein [Bacteroidaceae bacterium]